MFGCFINPVNRFSTVSAKEISRSFANLAMSSYKSYLNIGAN